MQDKKLLFQMQDKKTNSKFVNPIRDKDLHS